MAVKLFVRVASLTNKLRSKLSRKSNSKRNIVTISSPVLVSQSTSPVALKIAEIEYSMAYPLNTPSPAESPLVLEEEHKLSISSVAESPVSLPESVGVSPAVEEVTEGASSHDVKEQTVTKEELEEETPTSDAEDAQSEQLFTSSDDDSDSDSSSSDSDSSSSASPPSSPISSPTLELPSRFIAETASTPSPAAYFNHGRRTARLMHQTNEHRAGMLFRDDDELKRTPPRSELRRSALPNPPALLPRAPLPSRSYSTSAARPSMRHASALPFFHPTSSFASDRLPSPLDSTNHSFLSPSRSRLSTRISLLNVPIAMVSEETEAEIEEHIPYNSTHDDRFIHLASLCSPRKSFRPRPAGMEVDREDLRKELLGKCRSVGVARANGAWVEEQRP
ncbi:hypothetical protein BCR35DRAFT_328532 [Leucosporidium creatinivorum]|uniref:Uncharacterized protein n=1 Tax=Leucosporidium creatinivorum TaxID=106004 RepID=A0A1Y2G5J6_9BASI|nr:hypothetical protein BCR35DRAFT_328532 [Leucosporidium creatinivorum]